MEKISRRDFLKNSMLGAGSIALGGLSNFSKLSKDNTEQPNIVLIMADDMGFSDIGCYGGEIHTPNLDRLANNEVRFSQFYNYARCCPTRASLMTGLHPHQAGIGYMTSENNRTLKRNERIGNEAYQGYLNRNCVTMAEALGAAGYQTFMSGKWHIGTWRPNWPVDRGFDRYFGIIRGASDYFNPRPEKKLLLDDQPFEEPDDFYTTDYFAKYGAKFIREVNPDNPFFLYTAFTAPHWPLQAWEEDIEKYKDRYVNGWDELRQERFARQKEMGLFDESLELSPRDREAPAWSEADNKEDWAYRMAVYAAMVDRMDQGVGQIIEALEETNQLDNTLVVFLSDNGGCAEPFGPAPKRNSGKPDNKTRFGYHLPWANASNTPFRLFKHWTYEGGIGTPCIAHWPKEIDQSNVITDQMGTIIDLMPTFLDAAGAEYPNYRKDYKIQPMEGQSLLPVLRNNQNVDHDPMCWEHEGNRAVRDGNWKLVSKYGNTNQWGVGMGNRTAKWELYDLESDRTELHNLAEDYPEQRNKMVEIYDQWADCIGVVDWEEINRRIGEI